MKQWIVRTNSQDLCGLQLQRDQAILFLVYWCIEQKLNEVLMIIPADTVPYPWTVMIHPQNTFLADFAMVNSDFLDFLTFHAPTNIPQYFDLISAWTRTYIFSALFKPFSLISFLSSCISFAFSLM